MRLAETHMAKGVWPCLAKGKTQMTYSVFAFILFLSVPLSVWTMRGIMDCYRETKRESRAFRVAFRASIHNL